MLGKVSSPSLPHAGAGARDPWLVLVLLLSAGLLALAWSRQEGYQIADSVEYLERAEGIVRGHELIDSQATRGFGFSGLLVPLFALADLIGLEQRVQIVHAAKALQVLLSLALVVVTARLGTRLGGRAAGIAAAAIVGTGPVVLRWGVEPVSGVAAALFIALAVGHLQDGLRPRQGAQAGAWLGLALIMAYQSLLVIGALLCVVLARDLRRRPGFVAALSTSLVLLVLLQCVFDWLYYGTFGISIGQYAMENGGTNVAKVLWDLGLRGPARWLYNLFYSGSDTGYQEVAAVGDALVRSKLPPSWYLVNLPRCLVWPALALVVLGIARSLRRPSWRAALPLVVIVINVAIMSLKGSKEFRLWLPFLPLIALFGGLGFAWAGTRVPARLRAPLGAAMLLAVAGFGLSENLATNTRRFGGFWRAMALVNDFAERTWKEREARWREERAAALASGVDPEEAPEATPKVSLSAAYHWSMFLRESPKVELKKLPHHLDSWQRYDPEQRGKDFSTLAELEWFVTHLPVLTENPDLFTAINRDFRVYAVFHEREVYEGLGPIYVLCRKGTAAHEVPFFDLEPGPGAATPILRFEDDRGGFLELCDMRYQPLPGDGHGWVAYTWRGGGFAGVKWRIRDVFAGPDGEHAAWNSHEPAYGMLATDTWVEERTIREGCLLVAEEDPMGAAGKSHYLGGAYRRGDLIPVHAWMEVGVLDEVSKEVLERMRAVDPITREPIAERAPPGAWTSPEGWRTSAEGLTQAKRFFLPVHPRARLADDGRPIPD
jgi:hypothetical protein